MGLGTVGTNTWKPSIIYDRYQYAYILWPEVVMGCPLCLRFASLLWPTCIFGLCICMHVYIDIYV